jgi:hypothetical protein
MRYLLDEHIPLVYRTQLVRWWQVLHALTLSWQIRWNERYPAMPVLSIEWITSR